MKTVEDASVRFPVAVLWPDCVLADPTERSLSIALVCPSMRVGDTVSKFIGLQFIDQAGNLFRIVSATIEEDLGPMINNRLNRLLLFLNWTSRLVRLDLRVELVETITLERAKLLVEPLVRATMHVLGPTSLRAARRAKSIPELIEALK